MAKGSKVFVGLGVAAAAVGAGVAGQNARARWKAQYPPVGEMVDMGGYRLHLQRLGVGSPTVVLEAGQGGAGLIWEPVMQEIARFTQVVAYDRAGLGWSDPSPRPRTAEAMVDELHSLLEKAGIPGPYVLVGWSTGAMNVRLFAHRYPGEVVGLVLVDPAHEDQFAPEPLAGAFRKMRGMMPLMFGFRKLLVRSGLPARFPGLAKSDPILGDGAGLPDKTRETLRALLYSDPKFYDALAKEMEHLPASQEQLRTAQIKDFGDLPLVVLSHGKVQAMMTPELTDLMEATIQRLHQEMADSSTAGRRVIIPEATHNIPLEHPDSVVKAVQDVIQAAAERSGSQSDEIARGAAPGI
jgi:pimeloyl-ACP methyl ester carboxylesterase